MNKRFFSLLGLAMVLSIAIHLASPSTVRAIRVNEVTYFFAEESLGTPIPKASWELVGDAPITLNLWAGMFVHRDSSSDFTTTWDISYRYSGGITAGDLNIEKNIATSGDWYDAMGGNWSDSSSGSDSITWTGEVLAGKGNEFEDRYFLLGSITLSANKADLPIGGVFTMSNRNSATYMSFAGDIPTSFTTTITVLPEPGTWAMLAGAALVGGAWMRRRKNIAVR